MSSSAHMLPGRIAAGTSCLLLGSLPAVALAAAPPAAPPDARGAFAVYCVQACGELDLPDGQLRTRLPREARRLVFTVQRLPAADFGLPAAEDLALVGRGELSGLSEAQEVAILSWAGPVAGGARQALAAGEQALDAGMWVEDLDTGLIYDSPSFQLALDGLRGSTVDVTSLAVVRSEDTGGALVMRTLGLRRLGLPELVVGEVTSDREGGELAIALNATAQAIAESGLRGELRVGPTNRSPSAIAGCTAEGHARLTYARGRLDDGLGVSAALQWTGQTTCQTEAPVAATDSRPTQGSGAAGGGGPLGAESPPPAEGVAPTDLALPVAPGPSDGAGVPP